MSKKKAFLFYALSLLATFLFSEILPWFSWAQHFESTIKSSIYCLNPYHDDDYDVVVVGIDEKSFAAFKNDARLAKYKDVCWPWPPALHADLLEKIAGFGATKIGFDILFSESYEHLYLPDYAKPDSLISIKQKLDLPLVFIGKKEKGILTKPLDCFLNAGCAFGMAMLPLDSAGVVWKYRFFQENFPSFALALVSAEGGEKELASFGWTPEKLAQDQYLSYRNTGERAFPCVSFTDILLGNFSDTVRERWHKDSFKDLFMGKTVLVGPTSLDSQDAHITPFGRMYGVIIHAHAVQMLQRPFQNVIQEIDPKTRKFMVLGLSPE